jgi:hypothetical protein
MPSVCSWILSTFQQFRGGVGEPISTISDWRLEPWAGT